MKWGFRVANGPERRSEVDTKVHVQGGPKGPPTVLFEGVFLASGVRWWDLAPDGRRFLMIKDDPRRTLAGPVVIVENWFGGAEAPGPGAVTASHSISRIQRPAAGSMYASSPAIAASCPAQKRNDHLSSSTRVVAVS